MSSADDYVPEDFVIALQTGLKGFKQLCELEQVRLAMFAWDEGASRRKHKHFDGFMTIHHKELEQAFGRDRLRGSRFNIINAGLKMFEVTKGWSKEKKLTKGYRLTEQVQAIKEKYLSKKMEKLTRLFRGDGNFVRTLPQPIDSKDTDGVTATAWRNARVQITATVDLDRLKNLFVHLEKKWLVQPTGDLFANVEAANVEYRIEALSKLIKMAHTDVAGKGQVIHRYAESKSGRLYAKGVSLQTVPRTIRDMALHGLMDYDIENCHFAIFSQMAARYGYTTNAINHYLANKNMVRQGIADRAGIKIEQAKMCLLASIYGARVNTWHKNAIPEEIGQVAAARLFADAEFMGIAEDIKQGRRIILAKHPKSRTTYKNAMGKRIKAGGRDGATPEEILAHLIQGVEAQALRKAVSLCGDGVVVLMHDGFVSREQIDTAMLEQGIFEETGYRLQISGKRIALPADMDF